MLVPTKEYTSVAEMLSHYGKTRQKFREYERYSEPPLAHVKAYLEWRNRRSQTIVIEVDSEPIAHVMAWNRWRSSVTIFRVKWAATQVFGFAMSDLNSNSRKANMVKPRQIAMAVAQLLTKQSLPEIGRRFGGRDHTTVLHAVRKMRDFISDVAQGMPLEATPEQWLQVVWWRLDNGQDSAVVLVPEA